MRKMQPPYPLRYGVAILAAALAPLLTWLLRPQLTSSEGLLSLAAVMISAWYGGLGPGLLTTALDVWARAFFFMPPVYSLRVGWDDFLQLVVFVLVALLISSLNAARRRAEETLQEREEHFRRIFEEAPIGMAVIDSDYRYLKVNRALCEMLGYTEQELTSLTFIDITHPDDIEASRYQTEHLFKQEKPGVKLEKRYIKKNQEILWAERTGTVIREQGGKVVYGLGMIEDISDRKRAEIEIRKLNQALEQRLVELTAANKELESFSYSVSHDLRAPLVVINGFAELLREDYADKIDGEGRQMLNIIRKNTQKMEQLIDDLLAFSRLGRQALHLTGFDMGELARAVFDELRLTAPERRLRLNLELLPPARGDRAMIRQVFVNLLSNAIKFTRYKEAAVIVIGGRAEGSENIYYVQDNGAGFGMQHAKKLFGVFERLHSAKEFEGTGVGLALVQRIIHRHGGRVWAEGKVNEGATFYFTLPAKGELV